MKAQGKRSEKPRNVVLNTKEGHQDPLELDTLTNELSIEESTSSMGIGVTMEER